MYIHIHIHIHLYIYVYICKSLAVAVHKLVAISAGREASKCALAQCNWPIRNSTWS